MGHSETPDAQFQRASALHLQGQVGAARELYEQVLAREPRHVEALHLLGVAHAQARQFEQAVALLHQALAIDPSHASASANLAAVLQGWEQYRAEASDTPLDADGHIQRGIAQRKAGRWAVALSHFEQAIELAPGSAQAHNLRGVALRGLRRNDDALHSFEAALDLDPAYAVAWSNKGNALSELGRTAEALASYARALELNPEFPDAWNNRGLALLTQHHVDQARVSYARAIAGDPGYAQAHWNLALCDLLAGEFESGWKGYEWRWKCPDFPSPPRHFAKRQWQGEALQGQTVLVHAEQGLGDTLQFCRYASLVRRRGGRVVLEVQPPLRQVLASLDGPDEVIAAGSPLPPFDLHCPMLSLPLACAMREDSIPSPGGYLASAPEQRGVWAGRLGVRAGPRVGLVWAGNATNPRDAHRSVPLALLLAALPAGPQYVSLQKELRPGDAQTLQAHPHVLPLGHQLQDFADTAAVCDLMDLVISVDTSVAHLAGALGRPVWVLLPFTPDWRWQLGRRDSPWYAHARLFRQSAPREWAPALSQLRCELETHLASL